VAFSVACRRLGIRPSPTVLCVSVARQELTWFRRPATPPGAPFTRLGVFRASTSRFGIGQVRDTCRTPLGLHRIARKIGAGWPVGTAFKARQPIGYTWAGHPTATIAHRILWMEGLEPGLNRGGEVDTLSRYIYIHGLADEPTLGRPASHGCIHLAAGDLMPLFDRITTGTLVWIAAAP
jgi:hypothetical protein